MDLQKKFSEILSILQYNHKNDLASILSTFNSSLYESIPGTCVNIKKIVEKIEEMLSIFCSLNPTLSKKLKKAFLNLLETIIDNPNLLTICVISLITLEISSHRNFDRIDIESDDLLKTAYFLKDSIMPTLLTLTRSRISNVSNLYTWCSGSLYYTYSLLTELIYVYSNLKILPVYLLSQEDLISLKEQLSPQFWQLINSVPVSNKIIPNGPTCSNFKLIVLFAFMSHVKVNGHFQTREHMFSIESSEVSKLSVISPDDSNNTRLLKPSEIGLNELEELLKSSDVRKKMLGYEYLASTTLDTNNENIFIFAIKNSQELLNHLSVRTNNPATHIEYTNCFQFIIIIWTKSIKSSQKFSHSLLPLWFGCFSDPCFKIMPFVRFINTVELLTRLLLTLQFYWRKLIISSGHWYISIITNMVIGVLDHLEICLYNRHNTYDEIDSMAGKAITSIGKVWNALGTDQIDFKKEISHLLKLPIECIFIRMAEINCDDVSKLRLTHSELLITKERDKKQAIRQQVKRTLFVHILDPLLNLIDTWALGQITVSIKPPAAKMILNDAIKELGSIILPTPVFSVSGTGLRHKTNFDKRKRPSNG